MATWAVPAAMAGASIGSSLIGGYQAKKAGEKYAAQEAAYRDAALAALESVGVPSIEAQRIILEEPQNVFNYVPQTLVAEKLKESAFEDIELNPEVAQMKLDALGMMQERTETGLSQADEAEIAIMRRKADQSSQARQKSILQQAEQRGMLGAGATLGMQGQAADMASQEQSEAADRMAIARQQAKLEAIQGLSGMAGQYQQDEYNRAAQLAQAKDANELFNIQNRARTQQYNVDALNQGQLMGEQNKQRLSEAGTSVRNIQEQSNKALIQQDYENRLAKAQAKAAALTGAAQNALQKGQNAAANKMQMWQGVGQGLGAGFTAYGASQDRQQRADELLSEKEKFAQDQNRSRPIVDYSK